MAEIADLFEEESHSPELKRLERKIGECELQIESLQRRLARLKALVDEKKRRTKMEKFYLDKLPEIVVAYNRVVLSSYDQLGMHLISVVAPEMARLGCRCTEPGYCFTVETAGEYKERDLIGRGTVGVLYEGLWPVRKTQGSISGNLCRDSKERL